MKAEMEESKPVVGGASLTRKEISMREKEHRALLEQIAPDEFDVLHYGAIAELKKK